MIHYQYRADRARRTLRGIDEQVGKAEKAVAGKVAVKRNRYVQLAGGTKSVNRELEAKTRALAGWKGYTTNLVDQPAEFVIGAYHQLWHVEKSFRMSKHDLKARPIYHHKRESIEAHLTIVFAALAVTSSSRTRPAGRSRSSCGPPGATEPSRSTSASTPSPPKTHSQPTYATRSPRSTDQVRTSLARVRLDVPSEVSAETVGPSASSPPRCPCERVPEPMRVSLHLSVRYLLVETVGGQGALDKW